MRTPAWNPNEPQVPFDVHGNMQHYGGYATHFKVMYPFTASLKMEKMSRGRSAAFFYVIDEQTGKSYPMFMADLFYIIENHSIVQGVTPVLEWVPSKRGQNYGIKVKK